MTNYPGTGPYSTEANSLCSIIIPVYNTGNYILETIDSIRNQTYTNWECIFVDDGCTDNTVGLIKQNIINDPKFRIIKRPLSREKGPSSSRNVGFENSSGEYIQFFDADDIMHPQHLEKKISLLTSLPVYDFVVCQSVSFETEINKPLLEWWKISSDNPFEDHVCGIINFLVHGPMFRRDYLAKQVKLFDENIRYNEEWELFSRLLQSKSNFLPLKETLVYYRVNPNGSTLNNFTSENRTLDLLYGYYKGFKEFETAGTLTPKIRKVLIQRYVSILKVTLKLKYRKALKLVTRYMIETDTYYAFVQLLKLSIRHLLKSLNSKKYFN
jgi:glycosyltransferase involved in cell wall biosynthesis